MEKEQEITNITSDFIESVKELISNGTIKNQSDLAEKLDWDASTLSETLNKKRNVPHHIYTKFKKTFLKTDGNMTNFVQNQPSQDFFKMFNDLVRDGVYKNGSDLSEDLEWSNSNFSQAKNGRRNVPKYIISKLRQVAHTKTKFKEMVEIPKNEFGQFSCDQFVEAVKEELISSYGGLANDSKGNELQTPYLVLGIVHSALNKLKDKDIATKLRQNPADVSTSGLVSKKQDVPYDAIAAIVLRQRNKTLLKQQKKAVALSDFEIQRLLEHTDKVIERRADRIAKKKDTEKKK